MDKTLKIYLTALCVIVILVVGYILVTTPEPQTEVEDNAFQDSLLILKYKIEQSEKIVECLEKANDSLLNLESEIIYRYRDKIHFIYLEASPAQLDSIIRSKWDIQYGYDTLL